MSTLFGWDYIASVGANQLINDLYDRKIYNIAQLNCIRKLVVKLKNFTNESIENDQGKLDLIKSLIDTYKRKQQNLEDVKVGLDNHTINEYSMGGVYCNDYIKLFDLHGPNKISLLHLITLYGTHCLKSIPDMDEIVVDLNNHLIFNNKVTEFIGYLLEKTIRIRDNNNNMGLISYLYQNMEKIKKCADNLNPTSVDDYDEPNLNPKLAEIMEEDIYALADQMRKEDKDWKNMKMKQKMTINKGEITSEENDIERKKDFNKKAATLNVLYATISNTMLDSNEEDKIPIISQKAVNLNTLSEEFGLDYGTGEDLRIRNQYVKENAEKINKCLIRCDAVTNSLISGAFNYVPKKNPDNTNILKPVNDCCNNTSFYDLNKVVERRQRLSSLFSEDNSNKIDSDLTKEIENLNLTSGIGGKRKTKRKNKKSKKSSRKKRKHRKTRKSKK